MTGEVINRTRIIPVCVADSHVWFEIQYLDSTDIDDLNENPSIQTISLLQIAQFIYIKQHVR